MKQRAKMLNTGTELEEYNMQPYSKGSDDEDNCIQLQRIRHVEHFIEAQIQQGDTLQAIALRFHTTVSELKRINNIHKDNEIFARRTIKIPVTPYSILTENLPAETPSPSNGTVNQEPEKKESDHIIDYNAAILNSQIAPAVVPYTDEITEQAEENTQLIPNKRERVSVESVVVKELTSHGADFGMKWYHLLGCVLILGVVIPLVYVMFYLKPEHEMLHVPVSSHPPH